MNLPRVVVRVADRQDGGWAVEVHACSPDALLLPAYEIGARPLTLGGVDMSVPAVPQERMPPADDPHHALCAGEAAAMVDLLDRLATRSTVAGDVVAYGRWLFECLLAPAWPAVRVLPGVMEARGVEF